MRDKIFDYLDNDLSPTERQAFERQLAIDPELQTELEVQRDLMAKLQDASLRQQAQAQLGNWKKHADEFKQQQFRKQLWIWGSVLGIAAFAVWALLRYLETNKRFDETEVAQKPVFQGGEQAWQNYLRKIGASLADKPNLDTVKATFIVEKDGSIQEVQLLKRVGSPFDAPILDALRTMPLWKPGRHKGKKVRVRMTILLTKQPNPSIVESPLNPEDKPAGANAPTQSALPHALDSALRVPVRQLIGSESALLARFENATQLNGNTDLQLLVHQYFTEKTIDSPKPSKDKLTNDKLESVVWLLSAMSSFEKQEPNTPELLSEVSALFFKSEKAFYQQLWEAAKHPDKLKAFVQTAKCSETNIHYEKCLQLKKSF
ncbi:MAG: hypothetical protein RLZZ628_1683 [Bacteroidota bacterium]|jgi:protein TonB